MVSFLDSGLELPDQVSYAKVTGDGSGELEQDCGGLWVPPDIK
jgi:hypothetical protein